MSGDAGVAQAAQDRIVRTALLAGLTPDRVALTELLRVDEGEYLSPWSDTEENNDG